MILDLNNLSISQVKELNRISLLIQPDFNDLTYTIITSLNEGVARLVSIVASRHTYQSDLFLNCCHLALSKFYLEEYQTISEIIVTSKEMQLTLQDYIQKSNKKILIECKTEKSFRINLIKRITPLLNLASIIRKSIQYVACRRFMRKNDVCREGAITLLDTFILADSLNSQTYIDRYYPGILDLLNEDEKKRIYFVPTIIGNFNKGTLDGICKNSKEQIIYKHDFLKIIDYFSALARLFKLKLYDKEFFFLGFNISPIILDEFKVKRYNSSSFEGLLNYSFVKRLKKENIKIKLVIDWNENQPIDKGLVKGFKDFYPNVYIKGYQGYIISTDFNFYIQPTGFEIANGVIPDEICVVGKNLEKKIKEFSQNLNVLTAPAFRFVNVYKNFEKRDAHKKILVALPIGLHESFDILILLSRSLKCYSKTNFKIQIKPHPSLNLNKLIQLLGESWKSEFHVIGGDFNECVSEVDLLIGSTSTTLLEAITRGIPVIVVGSQNGITQNPIPEDVNSIMWELSYTPLELVRSVQSFLSLTTKEKEKLKKVGEKVRENYFEPVTKENVRKFLMID